MTPPNSVPDTLQDDLLTRDQQDACKRLLALARVRASATENIVPLRVLARWSVPFLVGPAGSGKEYVCQEVARRLGNQPCRRWEVGSWVTVSNRPSGTTLEQIGEFMDAHPQGCVVYLAGIDTLATVASDRSPGYRQACVSEIERLLGRTASRSAGHVLSNVDVPQPNVLVVVGGRFSPLWGDADLGGPSGAEAWKNADHEPLTTAHAVSSWLAEHSQVPAGVLRRLAREPFVLRRLGDEEARQLAKRLCRSLPASLDGVGVDELAGALLGPGGWQAAANVIEQALLTCYEDLPAASNPGLVAELAAPSSKTKAAASSIPRASKARKNKPPRLADRLGLALHRSTLLPKARRLGLKTVAHLEALAMARGYILPDDCGTGQGVLLIGPSRKEFGDIELAVALLSPGLEFRERTICRGALMLQRMSRTAEPHLIARATRQERAYTVVRHIALLGAECHPEEADRWRNLLGVLPRVRPEYPKLPPGVMPDEVIRRALTPANV